MTQLTVIKEKPLADLYEAIDRNKTNPSGIARASMEALDSIMDGTVGFIDPTNPTVMLWESSAVAVAAAVNENIALLRRQYPSLAETPSELYSHMSDWDYTNRFATPATVPVSFLLGLNTLLQTMERDEAEKCQKAIIPRDTEVIFGNITFTLQYPIVIRRFDTGTLTVSYDAEITSPFQGLETNIIAYETRKKPDGVMFLYFQVPMLQLKIDSVSNTIQAGRAFKAQVGFNDQFFFARAFIRNSNTANVWKEIKTTHSDLVYDRREPTLVLKVEDGNLTATLPQIYTIDGVLLGDIKIHVYTTKGAIIENLEPYVGKLEMRALDPDRDLGVYTTGSLSSVPREVFSTATVTGGTDGLNFETLRKRVIFNSIGPQMRPITNVQIEAEVENNGFELIKNTDMITNRIFLATQKLPKPSNPRLITSANIGIETFITDKETLRDHPYVYVNNDRWTLSPKNLFIQENGILRMLTVPEIQNLQFMEITARVNHLNQNKYLFTPFHWVFDNSSLEFSTRAYYLDKPLASTVNFIRQNPTLELAVNTAARWVTRTETGYRLSVRVLSGNFYKALPDGQVSAQLMFYPNNEKIAVYLKGTQTGIDTNGERIFSFDIKTNYDIDENNRLKVLDVGISGLSEQDVWVDLETEVHVFLCTTSKTTGYVADASNKLFGAFQLPKGSVPITHESIKLTFGQSLKNLWARARSLSVGYDYETYTENVPMTYDRDVYATDPVTGKIFTVVDGVPIFTIEHHFGDPVLDANGDPVMKYRIGDAVFDPLTNGPKLKSTSESKKEVDLLLIDGRHYFVNDKAYVDYNQELIDVIVTWIIDDLGAIQNILLEKTKIYLFPKSQIGECIVDRGDGITLRIESEQSPVVDLYVPAVVFSDESLRTQLTRKTIQILDELLSKTEINNSEIESSLREAYGSAVTSIKLYQLGGKNDLHYAKVVSQDKRLSLKRILEIQADGTLIMKEDVIINFFKVER